MLFNRCPTLLIVGDNSPVVEAVVDCNSKLNPTKTTLLKVTRSEKAHIKAYIECITFFSFIIISHIVLKPAYFLNESTDNVVVLLLQMADCGGLPQVDQVGWGILFGSLLKLFFNSLIFFWSVVE